MGVWEAQLPEAEGEVEALSFPGGRACAAGGMVCMSTPPVQPNIAGRRVKMGWGMELLGNEAPLSLQTSIF